VGLMIGSFQYIINLVNIKHYHVDKYSKHSNQHFVNPILSIVDKINND
jgi:hypothetical protein